MSAVQWTVKPQGGISPLQHLAPSFNPSTFGICYEDYRPPRCCRLRRLHLRLHDQLREQVWFQ